MITGFFEIFKGNPVYVVFLTFAFIALSILTIVMAIFIVTGLVLMIKRAIYIVVCALRGFDVLDYEERMEEREFLDNLFILFRNKGKW
jgi:hypothetical protein